MRIADVPVRVNCAELHLILIIEGITRVPTVTADTDPIAIRGGTDVEVAVFRY